MMLAEGMLAGTLKPAEKAALEAQLSADVAFAEAYHECIALLQSLDGSRRQRNYKSLLHQIHNQLIPAPVQPKKKKIISFTPQQWRTAAIAASVAVLTSFGTMLMMRVNERKAGTAQNIQLLRHEINNIKRSQNNQQQQIATIKDQQAVTPAIQSMQPSNYTGTGFALTNDGYVITNYHVTDGADSVYIQTRDGRYHKARIKAIDPKADLAVLKIDEEDFRFGKGELPYAFAPGKAALGARIYTLGFPQDEIVYNEGYVSSRNGYEGDSMQYQLDVTASPGQSGAPVLDNNGNVLAFIRSKDNDGARTTYAVSSKALLRLLQDLKQADVALPRKARLSAYSREQQIEKLQDYTCMVQVYKSTK
jgi:S1-C subfamily serine protease